jgi:DNA topoisomerase-1
MGRYGAFVQIGTKDDVDKPKFAGLRPGQKMDGVTLEAALDLFKLPRALGTTGEDEEVTANIGRFGPYVRYGTKFVSIRGDDPYTITLERALELIQEKKIADANRLIRDFPEAGIQVLNGRYGPYVTNRAKNAKIPKDKAPAELTLEECEALLAAAPERRTRGAKKNTAAAKAPAETAAPTGKKAPKKKKKKRKRKKTKTNKKAAADSAADPQAGSVVGTAGADDGPTNA